MAMSRSFVELKVGNHSVKFLSMPRGTDGSATVLIAGKEQKISWSKDSQGIWVEFQNQVVGMDLKLESRDDGVVSYSGQRRLGGPGFSGVTVVRPGEEQQAGSQSAKKKISKIKAQMPGKIVKVQVKVGDEVAVGSPLLVMEAMKMENEIKSNFKARVTEVKIQVGQAVETGAELMILEPIHS